MTESWWRQGATVTGSVCSSAVVELLHPPCRRERTTTAAGPAAKGVGERDTMRVHPPCTDSISPTVGCAAMSTKAGEFRGVTDACAWSII